MIRKVFIAGLFIPLWLAGCASLDELTRVRDMQAADTASAQPVAADTAKAIQQALEQGIRRAVTTLGRTDGFYQNKQAYIPIPEDLQKAETLLRKLGQGKYADQFEMSLNRAAEKAIPEAMVILMDVLRKMTIEDAVSIIRGPENAATLYFRRGSEQTLRARFTPVVSSATEAVGVTRAYKQMLQKAGFLQQYLNPQTRDLDTYITNKAIDALFLYIAEEEEAIRQDPVARGTELLRRVFGYYLD